MRDKFKVAFIVYNRPNYFKQSAESIVNQVDPKNVYLFLDGPQTPEHIPLLQQNLELFKQMFVSDQKRIYIGVENLGPHLNYLHGLYTMFKEVGAEYVLYAQDDIIYSPNYMEQLEILTEETKDDDSVAMTCCSGENPRERTEEQIERDKHFITGGGHHIGFLWFKKTFFMMEGYLDYFRYIRKKYPQNTIEFRTLFHEFLMSIGIKNTEGLGADFFSSIILFHKKKFVASTAKRLAKHIGQTGHTQVEGHPDYQYFNWIMHDETIRNFTLDMKHLGISWQTTYPYLDRPAI
jgi:Glycosyl transferase family 2.